MSTRRRRQAPLVVTLAAVLLASACAGAGSTPTAGGDKADSAPGVTDDKVVIGTHQPLTGPAAPGYSTISAGARAMYSYINDKGGIHGRKIDYRVEDDGYNPTRTVEVVKKLVLQDEVFAIVGGLGTPTHSKVVDFLNSERVPDLLVASGALRWDDAAQSPTTFGFQVDYTREGKILGSHIKNNMGGQKVGVLHQNDDVGRDGMKGLDQFIAATIVARQPYDPANTDVLPQITALKNAGAQVVVCECVPAFTALAILTSARIGYKPQFVVSSIGADPRTLAGLLADFAKRGGTEVSAGALLGGLVGAGYLPDAASDDPWITLFKEIHQRYIPNVPLTNTVVYGMAQAYTFAQALKEAGRDVTRQKIIDTMTSGALKGPGLTPFGFGPDSHSGYTGAYVFKINPDTSTTMIAAPVVTDRENGPIKPAPTTRKTPTEIALVS
jgi:branched-chain amino acid transport system substrate-binding protein